MNEIIFPDKNCALCPRLFAFRENNKKKFPDKFNAPVPSFGPLKEKLLIIGLAPGLRGANFTGRPFTGDYAGALLFATLKKFGYLEGTYEADANDGIKLVNCRITNAVRCVPPENKPVGLEIKQCQKFLESELNNLTEGGTILALGKIAHDAVLRTFGEKLSSRKFAHAAQHTMPRDINLVDSYHCSRYNTQTKRLTPEMFEAVFEKIKLLT